MSTETREIIYSVKLDVAATNAALKDYTANATAAQKAAADLSAQNEDASKRQQTAAKKTTDAVQAEAGSIKALREQNKQLTAERNNTTLATEEGRKKVEALNKQLDENNKMIKANVDNYTKQKIGVGDYSGALDKLVPGLGATTTGIWNTVKASAAFIATPIGVVIGALGLAVGTLTSYFKGSEEGQNKLNKIMQVGGVIMEKITDIVENLGGKVFKFLSDQISGAIENFKKFADWLGIDTSGISTFFDEIDKRSEQFASNERKRNEQERELTVLRAQTAKEVAELIIKSQESEGQAKLDAFNKAIALQRTLMEKEKAFAQTRLDIARMEVEDDPTIENKQKEAEALADLYNAEAAFNEGIKKLNAQRIAIEKELSDARALQSDIDLARQVAATNMEKDLSELRIEQVRKETDIKITSAEKAFAVTQKHLDATVKSNQAQVTSEQQLVNAKTNLANQFAGTLTNLNAKNKELAVSSILIQKGAAIAQIIANMGIANAKAIAASPLTFGMPWVGINTASGVLAIANTVLSAAQQIGGFAVGGKTKNLSGTKITMGMGIPINRSNGDNMLATVRTGEVILNERQQAALGGSSTFREIGVPGFAAGGISGISSELETRNAFAASQGEINKDIIYGLFDKMPRQILVLQDFEAAQQAKQQVENTAVVV